MAGGVVGLDRQDEQILLTVQALNTEEAASAEGAPASGKMTAVYQAEGRTAEDALTQLILLTGKEPVYSHNRILLLGESICQDGTIGQAVDFFARSFQPRANVLLAVAKGSARELLTANFSDGVIPAQISEDILEARNIVRQVYMDEKIEQYIADIVFATRYPDKYDLKELKDMIAFGGSPRASINLALAARAYAFIKRRGYVIPEDVRAVAHDVLRHRIGLTYEAEAGNVTSEEIISKILNRVEVP